MIYSTNRVQLAIFKMLPWPLPKQLSPWSIASSVFDPPRFNINKYRPAIKPVQIAVRFDTTSQPMAQAPRTRYAVRVRRTCAWTTAIITTIMYIFSPTNDTEQRRGEKNCCRFDVLCMHSAPHARASYYLYIFICAPCSACPNGAKKNHGPTMKILNVDIINLFPSF